MQDKTTMLCGTKKTLSAEADRLNALHELEILEGNSDEDLNRITRLVALHFNAPFAYISLIDSTVQQLKSTFGFMKEETPREKSFCTHTVDAADVFVVQDALTDDRFKNNPAVTGDLKVRFYAGAPLITNQGFVIGALCVMDTYPRDLSEEQQNTLRELAELVIAHIGLRRAVGRVNILSGMPNNYQLEEDLKALPSQASKGRRILVHIDMPDLGTAMKIAGFLGVDGYNVLMRNVAHKIRKICRGRADIYHLNDNQFALLSTDGDTAGFRDFVRSLHKNFSDPVESANIPLNLLSYGGLVEFEIEPVEIQDVTRKALAAAHQAFIRKQRWCNYDITCDISLQRSFTLLTDIHSAIRDGDFRLEYQPKLDLATGRYDSVEALLRWTHKKFGPISPAEFVPLVEKTALIKSLTNWVLDAALCQIREWKEIGLHLKVAINLSPRNFEEDDIVERIKHACLRHEIYPDEIEIECTEGVWMDGADVLDTLHRIRRFGIQIALDDFGTGYSNFAYLQEVPASVIKIDRSLISEIDTNPRAGRVVRSLIELAKQLQYRIVAEGVEMPSTLRLLQAWGVDEVQGYLLSRPLIAKEIKEFVRNTYAVKNESAICLN